MKIGLVAVLLVFAARGASAAAGALAEDDARKSLVVRDDGFLTFEVGALLQQYSLDSEYWPNSGPEVLQSGVGLTEWGVVAHFHMLRTMGVGLGYYFLSSGQGGVAPVPLPGGGVDGKPGPLSDSGLYLSIEANPIGFGPVQTCLGSELHMGDEFLMNVYLGLRFEVAKFVISPRLTYVDFSTDSHDYSIGTNYLWGYGFGVRVSYNLAAVTP